MATQLAIYIYNKIYNKPPSLLENSKNMYNRIKSNVKDLMSERNKIIKSVELLKNKVTTDLVYENKTDILKEIDELLEKLNNINFENFEDINTLFLLDREFQAIEVKIKKNLVYFTIYGIQNLVLNYFILLWLFLYL